MTSLGLFTFLGTSNAEGVPVIGCSCDNCTSPFLKNKRLRSSGLVELNGKRFIIDTGPDLRMQLLKYGINYIDGVLYSHPHYDHIGGLDELRIFYFLYGHPVKVLLSDFTYSVLKQRTPYLFKPITEKSSLSTQLNVTVLYDREGFIEFEQTKIGYVSYYQGDIQVTGFIFGDFAYITDIKVFDWDIIEKQLSGIKTLVLGVGNHRLDDSMHLSIEEAIRFSENLKASRVFITHISHNLDIKNIEKDLPKWMSFSYDGLSLKFSYDKKKCLF